MPDVDDDSLTENTRACYPLDFIPNADEHGMAPHPENVIMLTCDAFGVHAADRQAHRRAGDVPFPLGLYRAGRRHRGRASARSRKAAFSTCFGAPFMPRHPSEYAKMLGERIARYKADCWLVNTGWSGGAYGVGKRMAIAHTRALLRAALDGSLAGRADAPGPQFRVPRARELRRRSRPMCSTRAAPGPTRGPMTRSRAACAAGSSTISPSSSRLSAARSSAPRSGRRRREEKPLSRGTGEGMIGQCRTK